MKNLIITLEQNFQEELPNIFPNVLYIKYVCD